MSHIWRHLNLVAFKIPGTLRILLVVLIHRISWRSELQKDWNTYLTLWEESDGLFHGLWWAVVVVVSVIVVLVLLLFLANRSLYLMPCWCFSFVFLPVLCFIAEIGGGGVTELFFAKGVNPVAIYNIVYSNMSYMFLNTLYSWRLVVSLKLYFRHLVFLII